MNRKLLLPVAIAGVGIFAPDLVHASVESSLAAIQGTLIGRILPLIGIIGIIFAGFSFLSGNPNAKNHLFLAVIGAAVGFGAPSIIAFIRGLIS